MGGSARASVVIPTHDREELLRRAIESVLVQTYEDFELLVVDDGSTDRTPDVVASYDDDRIRYLRHETNRGVSAARNRGLAEARGEYVAFLDSDDEWLPAKLETQVAVLEAGPADAVAVYCNVARNRRGRLKQFGERLFPERNREGGEELLGPVLARDGAFHPGSTLLVDRSVTDDLAFDETLAVLEDIDFLVQLLEKGELIHVDETLAVQHETGYPPPRTVRRARTEFLDKHTSVVADLETEGWCIRGVHDFYLAKAYLREGAFGSGIGYLAGSSVPDARQLAALGWSLLAGVKALFRTSHS